MPLMNYYRDQSDESVGSAAIRNVAWMIVTNGTNTAVYSTFTAIFAVVAIIEDIKYRQRNKKHTFVETAESLSASAARGFSVVLLLSLRSGPVSNASELITLAVWGKWDVTELFRKNIRGRTPANAVILDRRKCEFRF